MKKFIKENRHILFLLYMIPYMYCFNWLEARNNVPFTNIHCFLDDYIPFLEIFTIPYVIWFFYVGAVLVYLYFRKNHLEDYYKCVITLISGMTISLLIYYFFPNEQNLRPNLETLGRSNVFIDVINFIYTSDTKTNVLPSIHVFNSIAIHVSFSTSYGMKDKKVLKGTSLILCCLICMSTLCLKQHSVLDVISGFILYIFISQTVIYLWNKTHKDNAK